MSELKRLPPQSAADVILLPFELVLDRQPSDALVLIPAANTDLQSAAAEVAQLHL
jgi:hypothetical protein